MLYEVITHEQKPDTVTNDASCQIANGPSFVSQGYDHRTEIMHCSHENRANEDPYRITSYNVCYTKLLRKALPMAFWC